MCMRGKIMFCGENDPPLLGKGNAGTSTAEPGIPAQTHFDENQRFSLAANEVDLAAAAAEIPRQHGKSVLFEITCGKVFGKPPGNLRRSARGKVSVHRPLRLP